MVDQVNKLFVLKMALAKKSEDPEKLMSVEAQKSAAMDRAEAEYTEKKEHEASKIKARYD